MVRGRSDGLLRWSRPSTGPPTACWTSTTSTQERDPAVPARPRSARRRPSPEPHDQAGGTTVTVCRGGDCGNGAVVVGTDHRRQLRRLTEALDGVATVRPSSCLDACEHANVVVLDHDGEQTWLAGVGDDDSVLDDLTAWVRDAGAAADAEPVVVELHRFAPSRCNRHALEEED